MGDRGVGSWSPSGPTDSPPTPPTIGNQLRRLIKATNIMAPVKNFDTGHPAYLARREEALEAWDPEYEARPVMELVEPEFERRRTAARRFASAPAEVASQGSTQAGATRPGTARKSQSSRSRTIKRPASLSAAPMASSSGAAASSPSGPPVKTPPAAQTPFPRASMGEKGEKGRGKSSGSGKGKGYGKGKGKGCGKGK